MKIYRPRPVDGFMWVYPAGDSDRDQLNRIPMARILDWSQPQVEILADHTSGITERVPDAPWRSRNTLAFRTSSFELVREILEPFGQWLPAALGETDNGVWFFNATTVLDVLDEAASEIDYFPDQVRIMRVVKWVFEPEALHPELVFRITKQRTLLLTGDIVERLDELNISGLAFKLLWSDEEGT